MGESIDSLRKFHNWIKLQLITDAKHSTNGKSLLDVAVGRGGDIFKWTKNNIGYVTGIDNDAKSIYEKNEFDGAIQRYNLMKTQMKVPRCYFWNISATDPDVLNKLNQKDRGAVYDIVSCQFSFHYFVKDIDITLDMISKKLKRGGLFIGTASDGDLIYSMLEKNAIVDTPILKIKKIDEMMYNYILVPGNTNRTTYFEFRGALPEYFLQKEYLVKRCEEHGLELVRMLNFHEWNNVYHGRLSEYEMEASFLNFSFVFRKL
jgi:mRNA (guanine-N7-)-methyltransferase